MSSAALVYQWLDSHIRRSWGYLLYERKTKNETGCLVVGAEGNSMKVEDIL